jgi:hypothetical protein
MGGLHFAQTHKRAGCSGRGSGVAARHDRENFLSRPGIVRFDDEAVGAVDPEAVASFGRPSADEDAAPFGSDLRPKVVNAHR